MKQLKKLLVSALAITVLANTALFSGVRSTCNISKTGVEVNAQDITYKYYGPYVYYEYDLDTQQQARIIGYTGSPTTLTIPATINGRDVIIDSHAFEGCTSLKKVTVSEGIVRILYSSFADCPNLTEVNLPSTLQIVMDDSFTGSNKAKFTGPGVPRMVDTLAGVWTINKNILSITNSNKELQKYLRVRKIITEMRKDITYNLNQPNPGDPASVLNTYQATCGGFARVFYHICLEAGIPATDVKVVGDCHCHAWNYIKLSGKWYNVDVTNNINFVTNTQYTSTMFAGSTTLSAHKYANWYNIGELYDGVAADQKATRLSVQGVSANTPIYDVNGDGDVSIADAVKLNTYLAGTVDSVIFPSADCNQDGVINSSDVTALQNYLVNA